MPRLSIIYPIRVSSSLESPHLASSLINPAAFASLPLHKTESPAGSNLPSSPVSHYGSLLNTCVASKAIKPGKQLHSRLFQLGLGFKPHLATKLVHLYCVCNSPRDAHNLFDRIPKRNLFLWNVLIRCYAWNGPYEAAVSLYRQIFDHGLVPDRYTFPFVLKACSSLSDIELGRRVHERAILSNCVNDAFVATALIDMYAKCGCPEIARLVFDHIEERDDIVLWNSMLAGHSRNGQSGESLALFRGMVSEGLRPTQATLVTVVSASADVQALSHGRELHSFALRNGFHSDDRVRTALVDMYAKSGIVCAARTLFDRLSEKRVPSWNAMITGYAMHVHAAKALALFEEMKRARDAEPDHITFVGVLGACSRGGLVNEGLGFFESMAREHRIEPTVQHYTCMVDLLGHCGQLEKAYNLIKEMRLVPDCGVWGALLNSCKIHGEVELAEIAVKELAKLEPNDAGNYVILSNIYSQSGNWERVSRMRKMMAEKGIKKNIACSWIEVKNKVHAFLSGDTSHPNSDEIYAELKRVEILMVESGYVPNTGSVFHDVDDDEKINMVRSHSERLAIAFGLISTQTGARLMITKNLRICVDCHDAVKFISKITEREITVRDVNRYHHFKDGKCSCGDYW